MFQITPMNARIWSKLGSRGTFAYTINELAKNDSNLLLITADLGVLSGLTRFADNFPKQFINTGIAEQDLISISAGLASEGHTVFATTYATFISMRSYEQIRLNLAYMNRNVKIIGSGSGLVMGLSGNSHYGLEDLSLMRSIPNMIVLSPADSVETVKCIEAAYRVQGPVYIRLTGGLNSSIVYESDYNFEVGKAVQLRYGNDVTIFATGTMVKEALSAAQILEEQGISIAVINIHSIKPLDTKIIKEACETTTTKLIVSIEEHSIVGGLGSAIAEYKSTLANSPRQLFIGIPDHFGKVGEYSYLLHKYGLTSQMIAQSIYNELGE